MSGPQTFAEEFPHLTSAGKWLAHYAIALAVAVVMATFRALIGLRPFLSGWFSAWLSCSVWNALRKSGEQS